VVFFEDAAVSDNADWEKRKIYQIIQLVKRGDWVLVQVQVQVQVQLPVALRQA
jgi:hypothetical protein